MHKICAHEKVDDVVGDGNGIDWYQLRSRLFSM